MTATSKPLFARSPADAVQLVGVVVGPQAHAIARAFVRHRALLDAGLPAREREPRLRFSASDSAANEPACSQKRSGSLAAVVGSGRRHLVLGALSARPVRAALAALSRPSPWPGRRPHGPARSSCLRLDLGLLDAGQDLVEVEPRLFGGRRRPWPRARSRGGFARFLGRAARETARWRASGNTRRPPRARAPARDR